MDFDFSYETFLDVQAIIKNLVHDYEDGVRSYGQFLNWECYKCGAHGTLSSTAVGFTVYDNASSPPPNDWWIKTEIYPDCPGGTCGANQDISE